MADIISLQQLANASTDAQTLADAINGNDQLDVTSRLGATYPTLAKAIKLIMQKAPINSTPFATKAALLADTTLVDGAFAFVYNDTIDNNGIYQKQDGNWVKSKYNINLSRFATKDSVKTLAGVKTGVNIADKSKAKKGKYYNYGTGSLDDIIESFTALGLYPIEPNTEYKVPSTYTDQTAFFDENLQFVGGIAQVNQSTFTFTTPANARYIGLTVKTWDVDNFVLAKASEYPSSYVPYVEYLPNLKINESQIVKTGDSQAIEIVVSADLNDTQAQFKGKNAIQQAIDSITDASAIKRYRIIVKQGLYKITQANEFLGNRGYPCMVCPKDWVDIVGQGEDKTIVYAELPYNDAQIGASIDGNTYARDMYQTVYNYAGNMTISDITFVAKNLRYTLHQDDGRGLDKSRTYKNVSFIFKGDKGYWKPLGIGNTHGEQTIVIGGKSLADRGDPFACHNNIAFNKPCLWSFERHHFASLGSKTAIDMQNDGSLIQDKLELVGCSFGGLSYILNYSDVWLKADTSQNYDSFNHAEWQITGYGNEPFLFDNNVGGLSLRIRSTATGANNTIRFNTAASAYSVLVKNNHGNTDTSLYSNQREFIDGYIVQDGSAGLPAQAFGCLDLSDTVYAMDSGVNYTSMGKRLGNLSSNSKTLVVVVNGVNNTITFNKDYSNMSNAQIIAEINAQLTNATADLYSYGREYYPTITDICEQVYNNGSMYIAKGSLVSKQGGYVKLANGNDKVYGVALDDIPVMGTTGDGVKKGAGRVLKRGYIYADKSKAHFVLADNQSPSIGTRFAVSNGQLVTDSNGKISVDIDSGVVSINC